VSITFDRANDCTGVATYRVEGYSPLNGLAHGSLDVTVTACLDCHPEIRRGLENCGMTPYSLGMVTDIQPCGERMTFSPNRYTSSY
jgi:hypothetical protein